MLKKAAFLLAALLIGLFLAKSFLVINLTESLPKGIYLKTHDAPHRGDIVLVSPPDREVFREARDRSYMLSGLNPSGTGCLIKIMAAVPGDTVSISDEGMLVNGTMLPNSARKDIALRTGISTFSGILQKSVLLYTPHPASFDSRYFGPLPESCILSTLKPLITQ